MNTYPEIYEAKFGDVENGVVNEKFTAADCAINSAVLREICSLVDIRCKNGVFQTLWPWEVRISDWHADHVAEPEPHYILHVGQAANELQNEAPYELRVRYCDNHSRVQETNDLIASDYTVIDQAPGTFTVSVRGTFRCGPERVAAHRIACAYVEAMKAALPDYFILVDEDALDGRYIPT